MPHFKGNGIEICFEQQGGRTDVPLVLLHGITCQLTQWPAAFIDTLAQRELRIIRPDNRDVGRSAMLAQLGTPALEDVMAGAGVEPPYRLQDMAADVIALLDYLGLMDAHVLGLSMGGMIAQHLAIRWPERVRSLISVMSSTGNPALPPPTPEAARVLLSLSGTGDEATMLSRYKDTWNVIGGPHHVSAEVGIGSLGARALRHPQPPDAFLRQYAAILADGSRVERLGAVRLPTLVIHGDADPLLPPDCGRDTASAIAGARYVEIERLGHDLPAPLATGIATTVADFIDAVEVDRGTSDTRELQA